MKLILFILILLYLISCSSKKYGECTERIDKLLFDKINIKWGEIHLKKEYKQTIKVYNPTSQKVSFRIYTDLSEFQVTKFKSDSLNYITTETVLSPHSSDTLVVTFTPCDTNLLGSYEKGLHVMINKEILFVPLKMQAYILENFDSISLEEKLHPPIIEIYNDTFNFNNTNRNKKIPVSFIIKNTGERNLIIRKVETDCSCINSNLQQRIVYPGQTTTLNATFVSMGHTGLQYRTIRLFTNDPEHPMIKLTIKGYIE